MSISIKNQIDTLNSAVLYDFVTVCSLSVVEPPPAVKMVSDTQQYNNSLQFFPGREIQLQVSSYKLSQWGPREALAAKAL